MNKDCLVTMITDLFTITVTLATLQITIIQRSKTCMQQNKSIIGRFFSLLSTKRVGVNKGIPYRDIGTTARDISSQKCT